MLFPFNYNYGMEFMKCIPLKKTPQLCMLCDECEYLPYAHTADNGTHESNGQDGSQISSESFLETDLN